MLSKLNFLLATVFIISFFQKHVNCRRHWAISCTAGPAEEIALRNVITVPPNCPPGQELVNGICRDVWRSATAAPYNVRNEFRNVITVPPNCPPGQELVNGICRDVWRTATAAPFLGSSNIMNTVFENWRKFLSKKEYHIQNEDSKLQNEDYLLNPDIENRNVLNIPEQCPIGYKADALGNCRKRLDQ